MISTQNKLQGKNDAYKTKSPKLDKIEMIMDYLKLEIKPEETKTSPAKLVKKSNKKK